MTNPSTPEFRKLYDPEIRRMRGEGMTMKAIAGALGIHPWAVADGLKRMNLTAKRPFLEKPIAYNKSALVERKCPACQQVHQTTPETWTCPRCREIHERDNTAGAGPWYC